LQADLRWWRNGIFLLVDFLQKQEGMEVERANHHRTLSRGSGHAIIFGTPGKRDRHGWSDDARHATIDLVPGRAGWDRRFRQPLLSRTGCQAFAARRRASQP